MSERESGGSKGGGRRSSGSESQSLPNNAIGLSISLELIDQNYDTGINTKAKTKTTTKIKQNYDTDTNTKTKTKITTKGGKG